jgi:hypothetical protein
MCVYLPAIAVSPERIQRTGDAHGGSDLILASLTNSPETRCDLHQNGGV